MNELDQESPEDNLDLYCADGRFYDLTEESGVLTLRMRRSVRQGRQIIFLICWSLLLEMSIAFYWWAAPSGGIEKAMTVITALIPSILAVKVIATKLDSETWTFDKKGTKVLRNKEKVANFSKIHAVRAWRFGDRFYIALKPQWGEELEVGRFGFSRSERAWRDDAAQIAAFLGVPLEIPPGG